MVGASAASTCAVSVPGRERARRRIELACRSDRPAPSRSNAARSPASGSGARGFRCRVADASPAVGIRRGPQPPRCPASTGAALGAGGETRRRGDVMAARAPRAGSGTEPTGRERPAAPPRRHGRGARSGAAPLVGTGDFPSAFRTSGTFWVADPCNPVQELHGA